MEKNKKKILYLITSLRNSGPVNVLYSIIESLDRSSFIPLIITLKEESDDTRIHDFENLGVEVHSLAGSRIKLKRIKKYIFKNQILIVHSHGFLPDLICSKLPNNVIKISTMHNYPFEDYRWSFGKIKGFILAVVHVVIQRNLYTVACSKTVFNQLKPYIGKRLSFVRNGVDFKSTSKLEEVNPDKFIYVGMINKRKNVEVLVDAFSKPQLRKTNLEIVGSGSEYEKLKEKSIEFSNIKFVGFVEDPSTYLDKNSVFISPSKAEGLPMAVIEALSHGLKLLLSDIPSHMEILEFGEFGYSFNAISVEDIIDKVKKIKVSNWSKKSIFERANKEFNSKRMSLEYQQIYRGL